MKRLSFFLLTLLCGISCNTADNTRPDDVLPKEKMVAILADIHIAEGVVSAREMERDTSLQLFTELEQQFYRKHNVSKEKFRNSYTWYTHHMDEYKDLYHAVVEEMNAKTGIVVP